MVCQYIDLTSTSVNWLCNKLVNRVSDTLQQLTSWYYIIFMIQMYIISINIFIYYFIKGRSQARKFRDLGPYKITRGSVWRSTFTFKMFWRIKRFLEPILPTRKTKWLLFSEKLWKSDSIYFNPRRRSQNCFKEFQKWVVHRVNSENFLIPDLLTFRNCRKMMKNMIRLNPGISRRI